MSKKRTLLTVVAMILVCVLSVMGTAAYLKTQTTTVTNTFVAAGGPGPFVDKKDGVEQFQLLEYKVNQSSTGKYTSTEEEVSENSYSVMQGTTIPKQAFVKLSRTGATVGQETIAPAPAYLYIEVIDGLEEQYVWSVDTANWKPLSIQGREIYLYTGEFADENDVITVIAADTKIDIITNDEIVVKDETLSSNTLTLKFNAYLAQASIGESDDPVAVFNACFGTPAAPDPEPGNP